MGALTVKEEDPANLDAQSNIATNEVNSQNGMSIAIHSVDGSKAFASNTLADANKKASGAYGSELEYSNSMNFQAGGYPLKNMVSEEDDEEYGEEEMESEFDDEEEEESLGTES